jgi:hypothetical protein
MSSPSRGGEGERESLVIVVSVVVSVSLVFALFSLSKNER